MQQRPSGSDRRNPVLAAPLLILTLLVAAASPVQADTLNGTGGQDSRREQSHAPYCGVYAAFGALRAVGRNVEFESLLNSRYIGSRHGSSVEELQRAIADHDAHAVVLSGLSAASLESARWPMILHVAADGQLREYTHWILFLGIEDGQARVVDAPQPPQLVPLANLLASWDGTALIVASRPLTSRALTAADHWMLVFHLALATGLTVLARFLTRNRLAGMVQEGVCIAVVAGALAVGEHLTSPTGMLRNPAAAAWVAANNLDSFFSRVSADQAKRLIEHGDVLVVDARHVRDYEMGHLPGAISIPVNATSAARSEALDGVPMNRPIMVYCQSKHCRFDDMLALRLAREGYQDITVFTGGWQEWEASGYSNREVSP